MEELIRLEKRIGELEQHVAHQDAAIQDLSDMTARQWEVIDALTKKAERLKAHIDAIEETVESGAPSEPPPPHY